MQQLGPYEINNIYAGECSEMMKVLPDACIDLTVTSPPYDNLRDYNGFTFDYKAVISQLYRVTKSGGVVVWVVADATINGSETGTSFRQALYGLSVGFNLHDTMIYQTDKPPMNDNRYQACFEYMFVWSKDKVKTFNPIMDSSIWAGSSRSSKTYRHTNGDLAPGWDSKNGKTKDFKIRGNVWYIKSGYGKSAKDNYVYEHAAIFPETLARDHILSWSNPNDLILDPFMGSGTTAKMAMQNGRNFLGFDISPEYVELAKKRVEWANPPLLVIG